MAPTEHLSRNNSYNVIQEAEYSIEVVEKSQKNGNLTDFETAIQYARFGKFQRILLVVCGMIYATCAVSATTLSFVLPSAKCDFELSSADKGRLSAMPLIGMIFGCQLWGSVADSHGRKVAIMLSLLTDFIAAVSSSFAPNFTIFLICRFFNGFGIIGATSIVFSYLGEFLSVNHRDNMLGRLEVFWNIGVIILPGVAWALLNQSVIKMFEQYDNDFFSPWRMFCLVCSLPSIVSLVMLYFLPETPKFLMSKRKFEKAKLVFGKIFAWNTGQPEYFYPRVIFEAEFIETSVTPLELNEETVFEKIGKKISDVWSLTKSLFTQPFLKYLGIACFADFGLMASYYTLIMWFPEIFQRFNEFEKRHPNSTSSVCGVSQNPSYEEIFDFGECNPTISNSVFLETIIVGISCIPTSLSLSYFMNIMGKKYVLVSSLVLSGLATLSLNWVTSFSQTLALSCVFEALTSILETVIFCVVVDLFPTNLRAFALATTATSGRLGAIIGNVLFGVLIDIDCIVPIYLFGSMLFASGLLCLAIPRKENYIALH